MSYPENTRIIYCDDQVNIRFNLDIGNMTEWNASSHFNNEYELHIILENSVAFSADNDPVVLNAGDAVLISPGVYHLASCSDRKILHIALDFDVLSPNLAEGLASLGSCVYFKIDGRIRELCRQLADESIQMKHYKEQIISCMVGFLFYMICRSLKITNNIRSNEKRNEQLSRTQIIDSFFEKKHQDSSINETQLADRLHVSRRQLARILQKHYGTNFRSKLIETRLRHAAWYLCSTDLKVSEISYAVGFSSEGSLYKNFQHTYGLTPLQYRKSTKNAKKHLGG